MVTYENIEKANSKMSFLDLKGKKYAMVPQRVKAFRMLYPEGYIITDILSHENNIVTMKAEVGYYKETGEKVILGTGMAFEEKGKGMVNGTSYIENCETSAVGRALGFLALGVDGDGICSAEELVNAITAQNKAQQGANNRPAQNNADKPAELPPKTSAKAEVSISARVPEANPVAAYINREITAMRERYGNGFNFVAERAALIKAGTIENVPSKDMTMEQAVQMVEAIYSTMDAKAAS